MWKLAFILRKRGKFKVLQNGYDVSLDLKNIYYEPGQLTAYSNYATRSTIEKSKIDSWQRQFLIHRPDRL